MKTGRSPMAQDHFKTPPDPKMAHKNPKNDPEKGAPGMEQAVLEVCAWGLFAIYICTSAAPCISMHVVILILMLQQSQMQGVQRLHL